MARVMLTLQLPLHSYSLPWWSLLWLLKQLMDSFLMSYLLRWLPWELILPSIGLLFHLLHTLMLDGYLCQFVTKRESRFYEVWVRALVFRGSYIWDERFWCNFFISMYICFVLLFLFHKHCWFIDCDSIFDVYSFDILYIFMFLWIQVQFLFVGFVLYFPHMHLWFVFSVSGIYRLILSIAAVYTSN